MTLPNYCNKEILSKLFMDKISAQDFIHLMPSTTDPCLGDVRYPDLTPRTTSRPSLHPETEPPLVQGPYLLRASTLFPSSGEGAACGPPVRALLHVLAPHSPAPSPRLVAIP